MVHLVLPQASYVEKDGSFTNYEGRVQRITKAFPARGDANPGWQIIVSLLKKAGGEVGKYQAFDITKLEAVKAFADEIHGKFGPMDIIINNAGIALFATVEDMTHAHWQKVINVDLWGPIHGIECFVPEMIRAKKGHIVNVSSTAGIIGPPLHAAYSSAKSGVVGLSEVLRYDLMKHNINVTVVCPGAVDTPLQETVDMLGIDRKGEKFLKAKQRFLRHAVKPEKVAGLIINAIERKKFLVITSFDIKAAYFLKHHCFPLYHLIMKHITKLLDQVKEPDAP
jgi:NAD(P)-dependent dehydrogenase (short-subunit alcohol dehydrogenase family)